MSPNLLVHPFFIKPKPDKSTKTKHARRSSDRYHSMSSNHIDRLNLFKTHAVIQSRLYAGRGDARPNRFRHHVDCGVNEIGSIAPNKPRIIPTLRRNTIPTRNQLCFSAAYQQSLLRAQPGVVVRCLAQTKKTGPEGWVTFSGRSSSPRDVRGACTPPCWSFITPENKK